MEVELKRFLAPYGKDITIWDDGFLPNPEGEYTKYYNEFLITSAELEKEPCVILLGEAGIGKTTLLKSEYRKLKDSGKNTLWVDLKTISDNQTLKEEIFKNQGINFEQELYLFLDGLDESIVSFDKLADRLLVELKKINIENLLLRISGRSNIFPKTLIEGLHKLYKVENKCFELAPLRRCDIEIYVKSVGIEKPDKFINDIINLNLSCFVSKPITIDLMIKAYKLGQFPKDQKEIYLNACKKLIKESNPYRIELAKAGHVDYEGYLTSQERLLIAGKIASQLKFNNKKFIYDGADLNINKELSFDIDELCSGSELLDDVVIEVSKENIREVLGTALFTEKNNHFEFTHQAYSDFLIAFYLYQKHLKIDLIMDLITFPESNGEIVPQMYEVASWLASFDSNLFEKLSDTDPEVLITSSVINFSNNEKLVNRLFELVKHKKLAFNYWSSSRKLKKLYYEGIEEKIKIYLEDNDESVKLLAIMITNFCKLYNLERLVLNIALNKNLEYYTRKNAFYALGVIASHELRTEILTIYDQLILELIDDKEESLKGCLLEILWPNYLDTNRIFNIITEPNDRQFFGSYKSFISSHLADGLKEKPKKDIGIALEWINSLNKESYKLQYDIKKLVENIYEIAFLSIDDKFVLKKLSETIVKQLRKDHWHIENFEFQLLLDNPNKRKILNKEIILNHLSSDDDLLSFIRCCRMVIETDVPWLIDLYMTTENSENKNKLGKILEYYPKNWILNKDNKETIKTSELLIKNLEKNLANLK